MMTVRVRTLDSMAASRRASGTEKGCTYMQFSDMIKHSTQSNPWKINKHKKAFVSEKGFSIRLVRIWLSRLDAFMDYNVRL